MNRNKLLGVATMLFLFGASSYTYAAGATNVPESDTACPVGLVSGMTLTEEFGPYVADNTRCIKTRHDVKTLFAINKFENSPGSVYALRQMQNVYNDYTITDGMIPGKDFQMVAIVHGSGGRLLLSDPNMNPYIGLVQNLMNEGVTFYFCENTVRGFIRAGLLQAGNVQAGVIPGTKFVTAGLSAISDFQSLGYQYDEP